jgi:hypothetical protein
MMMGNGHPRPCRTVQLDPTVCYPTEQCMTSIDALSQPRPAKIPHRKSRENCKNYLLDVLVPRIIKMSFEKVR